jgi:hypothetical protein
MNTQLLFSIGDTVKVGWKYHPFVVEEIRVIYHKCPPLVPSGLSYYRLVEYRQLNPRTPFVLEGNLILVKSGGVK